MFQCFRASGFWALGFRVFRGFRALGLRVWGVWGFRV